MDSDKYIEILQQSLYKIHVPNSSVDDAVTDLTNCLKKAANVAGPSKNVVFKGPKRRVSSQVLQCVRNVKDTYNWWKSVGKPTSGHLFLENKLAKKYLRSQQRMVKVSRRKSFCDSLMQNPSSEMFYKLIRRSKSKLESNSACSQVQDSKCYGPQQQRQFFAHYYEDLATPKDLH